MTEREIRRTVWTLEWQCYGKDRGDADYWVSKWPELVARAIEINHPQYAEHRVMGMGAGGTDVPGYGPYATPPRDFFPNVPLFPGDMPPQPPAPPSLETKIDALAAKLDELLAAAHALKAPVYDGVITGKKIVLTPRS